MSIGSVYRPFLEVAREQGVDIDAVLAELKLTYHALVEQNTRLTPEQGRAFARAIARALPDAHRSEEMGLQAAERFMTGDAHLVGYLMANSKHPLEAAHALSRHARLLGDSADYHVDVTDDRVTVSLGLLGGRAMVPQGADFIVAVILRLLRDLTRGRTLPLEAQLARPTPSRPDVYRRYFGAPVQFGVAAGALVFARGDMLAPFPEFDQRLARILTQHAEALLAQLPPIDSVRERVRALIVEGLAQGDFTLERIAWRCGLGERTLRRRLEEAGTSFRALVDEVRKERAFALLEHEGNVTLVAQSLGFSDSTAFARAFRRWTQSLPHQHLRGSKPEPIES